MLFKCSKDVFAVVIVDVNQDSRAVVKRWGGRSNVLRQQVTLLVCLNVSVNVHRGNGGKTGHLLVAPSCALGKCHVWMKLHIMSDNIPAALPSM